MLSLIDELKLAIAIDTLRSAWKHVYDDPWAASILAKCIGEVLHEARHES